MPMLSRGLFAAGLGGIVSGVLLIAARKLSAGSFENLHPDTLQIFAPVFAVAAIVVPGVLVGLLARQRSLAVGLVAGLIGWVIAYVVGHETMSISAGSWFPEQRFLPALALEALEVILATSAVAVWVAYLYLSHWSPNNRFERSRHA